MAAPYNQIVDQQVCVASYSQMFNLHDHISLSFIYPGKKSHWD